MIIIKIFNIEYHEKKRKTLISLKNKLRSKILLNGILN